MSEFTLKSGEPVTPANAGQWFRENGSGATVEMSPKLKRQMKAYDERRIARHAAELRAERLGFINKDSQSSRVDTAVGRRKLGDTPPLPVFVMREAREHFSPVGLIAAVAALGIGVVIGKWLGARKAAAPRTKPSLVKGELELIQGGANEIPSWAIT